MTHEYKAGDKVRVIDADTMGSGGHYENGDIFEVGWVAVYEDGDVIHTTTPATTHMDGVVQLYSDEVEPYDEAAELQKSLEQAIAVQQFFGGEHGMVTPGKRSHTPDGDIPAQSAERRVESGYVNAHKLAEAVTYGDAEGHPHGITRHHDSVKSPAHYANSKIETINYMADKLPAYDDGFTAHCVGNVIKYVSRAPHKHETPLEDLRKAREYLDFAIKYEEKKHE